jgi:2Fe-2S ferredoxin
MSEKRKIYFQSREKTIEFDPGYALNQDGEDGSILQIALENNIEIDHACGGVGACSTCHVIIRHGVENCHEPDDNELDQLDNAPGVELDSRLACQCIPNGKGDLTVEIPSWNRNRIPSDH